MWGQRDASRHAGRVQVKPKIKYMVYETVLIAGRGRLHNQQTAARTSGLFRTQVGVRALKAGEKNS